MNWLMIIGLVIAAIVLIVAVFIAAGFAVYFDLISYTAIGSKVLSPAGAPIGKALVVYDPGASGEAKKAAVTMAGDLQSKGYTVNLAGVRSKAAADISGYNVIIAGGPIYGSKATSSVEAYLTALKPQKDVALGVYGTTGWTEFNNENIETFGKQVASLPCSSMVSKKIITKTLRSGDAFNTDCADFVSSVLQ